MGAGEAHDAPSNSLQQPAAYAIIHFEVNAARTTPVEPLHGKVSRAVQLQH